MEEKLYQNDSQNYNKNEYMTIEDALDEIGFGKFQYFLLILCGSCWAADAMELMLLSFLLPEVAEDWNLSGVLEASIGSVVFAGIASGSYFWGMVSDRFGRKVGFIGCSLFTGVFGVLSALSPNITLLMISRTIVGFGLGGSPVAFSLFAEFLPTNNRGIPLVLFEVFWTIGTLAEVAVAWAVLPTIGWRWLIGLSSLPLFLLVLLWPLLPESPRFLMLKGRNKKALQTLERVARTNKKTLPSKKILPPPKQAPGGRSNVAALFSPSLRMITLLLWVIWFCNNFAYYGLVLFAPEYYKSNGSSDDNQDVYLGVFITTASEFPGLVLSSLLVDRIGRKKTQALFFIVCGLGILILLLKVGEWGGIIFSSISRMAIMGAFCTTYVYTPGKFITTTTIQFI